MQLCFLDLRVDISRRELLCGNQTVKLAAKPLAVLMRLIENAGCIISRETLLEDVWGHKFDPGTKVLDVQLSNLRKALLAVGCSARIRNLRGAGFRICT